MSSLTIKNIPDELYERLKAAAAANRRSLNNEVIYQLERMLPRQPRDVEQIIARVKAIGETLPTYTLNPEELEEIINEGRP
ncbi:MAG: Arc family DNA-binding protein [Anaerolineae bacterium]|nr:Arc family DNA-binding protein [Anaerolineae bacterium]